MQRSWSFFMALAVSMMTGSLAHSRRLRISRVAVETVHFGHHHIHQDEVDLASRGEAWAFSSTSRASRPLRAICTMGAAGFEDVGERVDIAHVVLDDEDAAAFEHGVAIVGLLQHALLFGRQVRDYAVQEEGDLVEKALRRFGALDDDRFGVAAQAFCSSSREMSRPV